jgi:hypothetical protein
MVQAVVGVGVEREVIKLMILQALEEMEAYTVVEVVVWGEKYQLLLLRLMVLILRLAVTAMALPVSSSSPTRLLWAAGEEVERLRPSFKSLAGSSGCRAAASAYNK